VDVIACSRVDVPGLGVGNKFSAHHSAGDKRLIIDNLSLTIPLIINLGTNLTVVAKSHRLRGQDLSADSVSRNVGFTAKTQSRR
jgi:hypothetical protein